MCISQRVLEKVCSLFIVQVTQPSKLEYFHLPHSKVSQALQTVHVPTYDHEGDCTQY